MIIAKNRNTIYCSICWVVVVTLSFNVGTQLWLGILIRLSSLPIGEGAILKWTWFFYCSSPIFTSSVLLFYKNFLLINQVALSWAFAGWMLAECGIRLFTTRKGLPFSRWVYFYPALHCNFCCLLLLVIPLFISTYATMTHNLQH